MADTATDHIGGELRLFAQAVNWKTWFARQMAPHINGRVLEVGAGIGGNTRFLLNDRVTQWLSLEPDRARASVIRALLDRGELPGHCSVRVGTLDAVSDAETFDSVLYIDVLEHVRDDVGELVRAARHLTAGGHLIVLSPAHPFLFSPFDRAIGHERRYNRQMLTALTPPACRIADVRMLDSAGYLLSLGNRLLTRHAMPTLWQIQLWDRCFVPVSTWLDPLIAFRFGKSILIAWRKAA